MSKPLKPRITIEIDEVLSRELEAAQRRTGLGRPEIGRVGLIKVIRELRQTGRVVAETLDDESLVPA